MSAKVLVIDDDSCLLTLIKLGLERDGFEVVTASSGREGLRLAYEVHPDAILLDIRMPEMDGWDTCERLRFLCNIPIVMLTGLDDQQDMLRGLSIGADDYITKPCSFDELKARLRAVIRRSAMPASEDWHLTYDDGYLRVDFAEGVVQRDGDTVNLTPTELRLLFCLVSREGETVSHTELLSRIWGDQYTSELGYLSVYVRYLRRKIEPDPSEPQYIKTRWGVGYYFSGNGAVHPAVVEAAERIGK